MLPVQVSVPQPRDGFPPFPDVPAHFMCPSPPQWLSFVALAFCLMLSEPGLAAAQPSTSPSLQSSLSTIDSLRSTGQFQTALSQLDSLQQRQPENVGILWRRALLTSDIGRRSSNQDTTITLHRRAHQIADAARTADSTNAWAHLVTALAAGRLTLHVGPSKRVQYSRLVKQHTDRAIALDPTLAPAYHLRGRWHRKVADLNFFTRALVRTIYGGLPDASFDQSIRDFETAICLESKPYNHLELAKTYLEVGRKEAARTQLQRALTTSGSPFEAEHTQEARSLLRTLE